MGKIYFVRHGQTVWNVENKICGASDIALTKTGHEQAIEAGLEIKRMGIKADEILYSPLIRLQTLLGTLKKLQGLRLGLRRDLESRILAFMSLVPGMERN